MTLDSYLTSNTKTNSKGTKDFNLKAKTIREKKHKEESFMMLDLAMIS